MFSNYKHHTTLQCFIAIVQQVACERATVKSPTCIELTRQIARARIHVEREIGREKPFHILDTVIPLSLNETVSVNSVFGFLI